MRITNKIMQRNNLSNINTNKVYQDKLSTQMSTQKKVSRPSDDPVVSIRALRLRSNVTEVTQYYSKNIPDAESWLDVTEDALKNLTEIITNMINQCTKASNGDLKSADRQIILEQLKALGLRWSQNKKQWYWHHEEPGRKWRRGNTSMEEIRRKYGSQIFNGGREEFEKIGTAV